MISFSASGPTEAAGGGIASSYNSRPITQKRNIPKKEKGRN